MLAAAAVSSSCGGDGGAGDGQTRLDGVAAWSGPVRGAEVVAFQLVDGARTFEVGRGPTGDDGRFSIALGATYEHVELDVIGGRYAEIGGDEVALDGGAVLHGVALDLVLGEQRGGVAVTPWTHLAVTLAHARLANGEDATYGAAAGTALARLGAHLGFDPVGAAIAPVDEPAASPTEAVRHGLSLAALSQLAAFAAAEQGATAQSVNTVALTAALARDAASAEARFDGNGADELFVGASCPPPPGCGADGPGCHAACAIHGNTLRARLGAAVLAFLASPGNRTALGRDDVLPWLEHLRTNDDAALFGPAPEPPEPFDSVGPAITWHAPAAGATVAGTIAIEVTAADALGVRSLTVSTGGPSPLALADVDPAPDRFAATLATAGLPEGALALIASADDDDGNRSEATRAIAVNNVDGGAVSGVVVKGRVAGATVRVYGFAGGVRGALLGEGTTQSDGTFTNVAIADGYSGALLVEAGFGGTYVEEAAVAAVALDVGDRLRTVIAAYGDGDALAGVTVSPLTTFAAAYLGWLDGAGLGGADLAARWATAHAAVEAHFGVASITALVPQAPAEMSTFHAAARYGMVLVGLSELARDASTLGGGDGGTFGSAMSAMRVVRVLETDVADGCWDGRDGGAPLLFGGTQAPTAQTTRLDLAVAIAGYLADGARNQSPYAGASDVLGLLDTLASGGGNTAPGSCAATGRLHPDAGGPFDQVAPEIAIATVPAGPVVGGVVTVDATASDALDVRPSLRFTAPAGTTDADGDESDADARASIDTRATFPDAEGTLAIALESFDDAGNRGTADRVLTVDNVAPLVAVTGVADGGWYDAAVTPGASSSDTHPASFTVTLDGAPFTPGTAVAAEGRHVLVATAIDQAGNRTARTVTFHVDRTAPALAVAAPDPSGTWVRGVLDVTVIADDAMQAFGSLGSDITVSATGPGGAVTPVVTYPPTTDGSRQVRARVDTTAIDDAGGGGTLALTFTVIDRAGHVAARTVTVMLDNAPPLVAIAAVRNQAGALIDGFLNEPAATVRGTVAPGGSPVVVSVTVMPGGFTAMVTPDAVGAWSLVTPALAEGAYSASATAADLAGNTTAVPATASFTVDRTPPSLTLLQSSVLDERNCDVTVNVNPSSTPPGVVGAAPVGYGTCDATGSPVRLDTVTAATHIGKITTRLTAAAADNPLVWLPQATDGTGVGLAAAPSTIQLRVYRTGQPPPAAWVDTAGPSLVNGVLGAAAHVTAAQWPELRAHTAAFTVELRAVDRLGNATAPGVATLTRSWFHHPLAPPVLVRHVGLANPNDAALGAFALARHSLVPSGAQVGLAGAMSSGFPADAPRGLYELEVWNPHAEPVNVGFYIPAFSGGTYARRVWEVHPYINGSAGIVADPPSGTCGWPARTTVFRMSGGAAPFACGAGTTCTCLPAPLADDKPAASGGALTAADLRVVAWDATPANPVRLAPQSLSTTVDGSAFYEFTVPARAAGSPVASRLRVMIALPNLDLFSPADDVANQTVLESDGAGAEVHVYRQAGESIQPTMTVVFKERWADCRAYNATTNACTDMHARRRLRATVQVALGVLTDTLRARVRSRAAMAATAVPEPIPDIEVSDAFLGDNAQAVSWSSCETGFPFPCPTIPDYANGVPF